MAERHSDFYGVIVDQDGNIVSLSGHEILFKASRQDGRWIQVSLSGENTVRIETEGEWEIFKSDPKVIITTNKEGGTK